MSDHNVGEFHFTDSNGIDRYWGRTCNIFGSAADARKSAIVTLRRGALFYVWRTTDGLYDWTATADANQRLPELVGAELVDPSGVERGFNQP